MIPEHPQYEVVIVGGSYAGLAASMTLGRSLRNTLLIDSGNPCNKKTPHAHNFLTQDGQTPSEIARKAREQVLNYPTVQFLHGKVVGVEKREDVFLLATETGEQFGAKKILFATGVTDLMPEIPGFRDCWGVSVLHCPYCHGYEVNGKKLGLIGNGDLGFEFTRMLSNWSKNLTLFTNGVSTLTEVQSQAIRQHGIEVIEKPIKELEHENGYVKNVCFSDETSQHVDALFAKPAFQQHCTIPQQLGCKFTEMGHIEVDMVGKTSIPGVFAAGDSTTPMRSLAFANASGSIAGVGINRELIEESF